MSPHKDSKALNCMIEREVFEMFEDFTKKTGLKKTATVERALREYIKAHDTP